MFPKLSSKAVLSPMAGVTDVAFRTLAKRYGAALTYTEFLSSAAIVRDNKQTMKMLVTNEIEKPVAVQLFGNNEKEIIEAAKIIEDRFDIIDINCGCPVWKVIRTGAGSEMLKDPEKIERFVSSLVKNISKPITVKIRSGIDDKRINAVEVAKRIENAGASAIAIHGRTQKHGYSGKADWEIIKNVKENVNIPVIGNGDVFTPETFKEKLDYSGVDYIMIARGAVGNPYIFRQIEDFMKKGTYETENKIELFFEYLELAEKYEIKFGDIKNQSISFTKGLGHDIRVKIVKTNNIDEIKVLLENYQK